MPAQIALDDYIFDVLMRDLVSHDHRPAAFLVYLWLAFDQRRKDHKDPTAPKPKDSSTQISYQELAENIGISKSAVQSAVSWLVKRRLLKADKENATAVPRYAVLTPWRDRGRRSGASTKL